MIFPLRRTQKAPDSRGRQRGQGNFELATNCNYIHLGQLTLAKAGVSAGSQSLPKTPTKCCLPLESGVFCCCLEGESQIPRLMWNLDLIFYAFWLVTVKVLNSYEKCIFTPDPGFGCLSGWELSGGVFRRCRVDTG